jgi:quercetin dioxygenase-like cupin family protein
MQVITWDRLEETRINENITRKMFWGENVMAARWELAPNSVIPVHEHLSEQITIVEKGGLVIHFPDDDDRQLGEGDMLVIPPWNPHGVTIGPEGCTVLDLFSPIRKDFIEGTAAYFGKKEETPAADTPSEEAQGLTDDEKYRKLLGYLRAGGIKLGSEDVRQIPLDLLSRYTYERGCITLGELRRILGFDKKQAKALLREWKHGDDHSESSLRRTLQRMVVIPDKVLAILSGRPANAGEQETHGSKQDRKDQESDKG